MKFRARIGANESVFGPSPRVVAAMQAVADGQLSAYRHTGFWQPMDTFRDWKLLEDLWASGNAPWSARS